jgi:hypothetical protein
MHQESDQADRDARRLRRYVLGRRELMMIFNGRVKIVGSGLPADASVHHLAVDYLSDSLHIFVHSTSFDPVPEGEAIPEDGPLMLCAIPDESWRDRPPFL